MEFLYSKFLQSEGVSIDSRSLEEGMVFFALRGPNFDGSKFIGEALRKGASFVVTEDQRQKSDDQLMVVEDSLTTLQNLSIFHRERFKRPVIGITGSNGKTTTKELIARVLSRKFIVHATQGNLNNHIGVPLTLLQINPQTEIAVVEMGASKVGDIAELCAFAQPTHGLITNIGHAHTETFGGIDGVLRGKTELFDFLIKARGTAFINTLDERLRNTSRRFQQKNSYPSEQLDFSGADPFIRYSYKGKKQTASLIGPHNFPNLAAAIAVGDYFGVPEGEILQAVNSYQPDNLRSQIIETGDKKIILDAYNANPDSMKAALQMLSNFPGKKAAILGDMLELENPEDAHRSLGLWLKDQNIDKLIFYGPLMAHAAKEVPNGRSISSESALASTLSQMSFQDFTILIKGSRSMRLEKVRDIIT